MRRAGRSPGGPYVHVSCTNDSFTPDDLNMEATHPPMRSVMTRQTTAATVHGTLTGVMAAVLLCAGATSAPAAGDTRVIVLNTVPLASYTVLQNQTTIATPTSSPVGTFSTTAVTAPGDVVTIRFDSAAEPFPPSQLTAFAATGQNTGCARLQWDSPPVDEYVQRYRIKWGTTSGVYTDSTTVDRLQVAGAGTTTYYSPCGFPSGTYYFVVTAQNVFDLWSPGSAEASATITNGNTQGPPIPQGLNASVPPFTGCADLAWSAVGGADVVGYRLYWRAAGTSVYTDSSDVDTPGLQVCGFSTGRYYFAVRSRTAGGLLSGYSPAVAASIELDVEGPVVSDEDPADGATGVPRNASVFFVIRDAGTGVDPSTIDVTIAGAAPSGSAVLGNADGYVVQVTPAGELPPNTAVTVTVRASDLAAVANETVHSWQFTTGGSSVTDTEPPVIAAVSPMDGAEDIKPDAPIVVRLSDAGLGVDVGSITMFVDDIPVSSVVSGTPHSLTLRYSAPGGFARGSTVRVRVEACDRAAPSNCSQPYQFAFAVEKDFYAGLPDGAIVPNGFWAGDPERPLEVRNLPMQWSVRIFDAAGGQVKRFRNTVSDGFVWLWDFTNDHNQRVARALYLVRVIDAQGTVRQSGRFLVQSDP